MLYLSSSSLSARRPPRRLVWLFKMLSIRTQEGPISLGTSSALKLAWPPVITLHDRHLTVLLPSTMSWVNPDSNLDLTDNVTNTLFKALEKRIYLEDKSLKVVRENVMKAVTSQIQTQPTCSKTDPLLDPRVYWPLRKLIEASATSSDVILLPYPVGTGQGSTAATFSHTFLGQLKVTVNHTAEPAPSSVSHKCEPAYDVLGQRAFMPELVLLPRPDDTGHVISFKIPSLLCTTLGRSPDVVLSQAEPYLLKQMAVSALVTVHRMYNHEQSKLITVPTQSFVGWFHSNRERIESVLSVSVVDDMLNRSTANEIRILPGDFSTVPSDINSTMCIIRCSSITGRLGPGLHLVAVPGPCEAYEPRITARTRCLRDMGWTRLQGHSIHTA